MPQQNTLDEIRINIGADASKAIDQLNKLSTALNGTATAVRSLNSATGILASFGGSLERIARVDISKTVSDLRTLNRLKLNNLKDKTIKYDFVINGAQELQRLNTIASQSSGDLNKYINAIRRLSTADMSKFDATSFAKMAQTLGDISNIGNVDNGINRFISGLARLANAGANTQMTVGGLKALVPELKHAVDVFQKSGTIDTTISGFVSALGQLASAGSNAGITAGELDKLGDAVRDFLVKISSAPQINTNLAMVISGLGQLAQAGAKTGSVMNNLINGTVNNSIGLFGTLKSAAQDTAKTMGTLLKPVVNLGKQGVSALGSFFGRLGLIPRFTSSVDRMGLSFGNLLRAVLPFAGLGGMFGWLKEAMDLGSGIVEVENVVNTMFGELNKGYEDISGSVYKWAQGTIDAFGVSELSARKYAGRLMAMFTSSGFDVSEGMRDRAAQMSMGLVERAGDIASFYDIDVDEAMTKIQAGIAGMNRPLRALGVNMTVANLEAFALSRGINTAWKEMDQATQQALRYEYIMDATKYSMGDFAKTSQSYANQIRLLSLNFQQLSATIGQGLISAIAPVIGWLNGLIRRLIQAANAFRTFMFTVFGKPLGAAKGVVNDLAGLSDDVGDSLGGIGSGGGSAGDGLGSAAAGAKELKKQLTVLPFDELNQLAKPNDTSSSGGSGGGGGGGGGVGGLGDLLAGDSLLDAADLTGSELGEAISEWGRKIKAAFDKQDWVGLGLTVADGINFGLSRLKMYLTWSTWKDRVEGFIIPFQTSFNSMMRGINFDLLGSTLATGLNTITYTLRLWFTGFNWREYGQKFAQGMNGFLRDWDAKAFGEMIAAKFMVGWNLFIGWVTNFDFGLFGTKLKEGLVGMLTNINWYDIGNSVGTFITGLGTTLQSAFEDGTLEETLGTAFKNVINGFLDGFDGKKVWGGLISAAKSLLGALGDALLDEKVHAKLEEDFGSLFRTLAVGAAIVFASKFALKLGGGLFVKSITGKLAGSGLGNAIISALGIGGRASGVAGATGAAGAAGAIGGGALLSGAAVAGLAAIPLLAKRNPASIKLDSSNSDVMADPYLNNLYGGDKSLDSKRAAAKQPTVKTTSGPSVSGVADASLNKIIGEVNGLASGSKITVTVAGKKDPSYTGIVEDWKGYKADDKATKTARGDTESSFINTMKLYTSVHNDKATKTADAIRTGAFNQMVPVYNGVKTRVAKLTADGAVTNNFTNVKKDWHGVKSKKPMLTLLGQTTLDYRNTRDDWHGIQSKKPMVTLQGQTTAGYRTTRDDWHGVNSKSPWVTVYGTTTREFDETSEKWIRIGDKWIKLNLEKGQTYLGTIKTTDLKGPIDIRSSAVLSWLNAAGGLFTGPAAFQVFGEAGAEAAIPLTNKTTMRRIGNAIVSAGGMGTGSLNEDKLANKIAMAILPVVTELANRPVAVNATLYTENDEVLARHVDRGNKKLDKRYNPVSQYSYG